jgi:hypothetical protein
LEIWNTACFQVPKLPAAQELDSIFMHWRCVSFRGCSDTSGFLIDVERALSVRQRKPADRDVGSGVSLASWQRSQATFFSKGRSVDNILSNVLRSVLAQDALLNEEPGYQFHSQLRSVK